jgi:hypothetical protein
LTEYTHWLVTKGSAPDYSIRRGYTPILLCPISEVDLKELRRLVEADAIERACVFLGETDGEPARLAAQCSTYMAQHLSNLFVTQVRLTDTNGVLDKETELATLWTLVGRGDPPLWQQTGSSRARRL